MARFSMAASAALLGCVAFASAGAQAQGLVTIQKLSAPLANELVGETVAVCAQKGYPVVAIVVDLDGVRQAMLRGDGAPIHSVDNAFYKAWDAIGRDRETFLRWTDENVMGKTADDFAKYAKRAA